MRKKRLYEPKNKRYIMILFFIIAGYLFFWNSKSLFQKNQVSITPTEFTDEMQCNNWTIKLMRWDYSISQKKAEVEIDLMNKTFVKDDYSFKAYVRKNNIEQELKIKTIVHDATNAIIQLEDIPDEFAEMVLHIQLDQKQTTAKVYATRDSVKQVDQIVEKTREEYRADRIILKINEYKNDIAENDLKINEIDQSIEKINEQIAELEENLNYQDEDQQEDTKNLIREADSQINDLTSEKLNLSDENMKLENLIVELESKEGGD